jgi:ADP-heptose:LPS heptosyltransferase
MATAEAKHFYDLYGHPCAFSDGKVIYYDADIYKNNHKIAKDPKQGDKVVVVRNYPGSRPYIAGGDSKRWYWNTDFKVEPGEVFLTPEELLRGERGRGKILIEPYVKETSYSGNKLWPHWDHFIRMSKNAGFYDRLIQFSYDNRPPSVARMRTGSFRDALAIIANVDLVVTTDGALHHACAAMNIPCITLWGGLIGPDLLGYDTQVNIRHETDSCGSKEQCRHCYNAMKSITAEEVFDEVMKVIGATN